MRTTLNIQDQAFEQAQAFAAARAMKLGDAVSELIALGAQSLRPAANDPPNRPEMFRRENGILVFNVDPNAPKVSAEFVRKLIEQSEDEDDGLL